jgi:hypothetical protein
MKKYCCYCFPMKKKTSFNSATEYFAPNTVVSESGSLSDTDVNRNSLLSALYTENPLHQENTHQYIISKKDSFIPPRRNGIDESDYSNDDDDDINRTWRVTSTEPSSSCTKSQ